MKKKILIVANNCPWHSWPDKIEDLKRWFAPNVELEVSITHTNHSWIPFFPYNNNPDTHGILPAWYSAFVAPLGKGYDLVLFVVPMSQWQGKGARGWRKFIEHGAVGLHLGADEFEPFWKYFANALHITDNQAFHQIARHEILHGLFYIKCGEWVMLDSPPATGQCRDTTHYWWDRDNLKQALNEVAPAPVVPPPPSAPLETIYIIHHTATPRDTTSLDAILRDHNKRYGRSFYQCFITFDGKIHWQHKLTNQRKGVVSIDYCVVGDFTKEKPTDAQLDSLSGLLGKNKYIGHNQAVKYGATASECPATLGADLEAYRAKLNHIQTQIEWIIAEIKRIFGLK